MHTWLVHKHEKVMVYVTFLEHIEQKNEMAAAANQTFGFTFGAKHYFQSFYRQRD